MSRVTGLDRTGTGTGTNTSASVCHSHFYFRLHWHRHRHRPHSHPRTGTGTRYARARARARARAYSPLGLVGVLDLLGLASGGSLGAGLLVLLGGNAGHGGSGVWTWTRSGFSGRSTGGARVIGSHGECGSDGGGGRSKCRVGRAP
jgi:hypothetical protein